MHDLPINNSCIDFLTSLPNDWESAYSTMIARYADEHSDHEPILLYVLEKSHIKSLKFSAFHTIMVIYRKQKKVSAAERLASKYKEYFKDRPLFLYQMSNIHKNQMTYSHAMLSIDYARKAVSAIEQLNDEYAGFFQNMADSIALAFENKLVNNSELIEEGISNINRAIMVNSEYAKYYCTLGRLLILKKEYSEAKRNILHAIDIEEPTRNDFSIRVAEYQDALVKCSIAETINGVEFSIASFEESKVKFENEFNRVRNSVIEFIGFFAAIIALVLASIQIAISFTLVDSIRLIGFLIGGIIIAIGSLRLVLDFSLKAIGQSIVIALLGISFILVTFAFVHIFI